MLAQASQHVLTTMLRAATQSSHQALDTMPILVEVASGTIEPHRYVSVIAAFGAVWRATEANAWAVLSHRIPEMSSLKDERSRLLDDDLVALGGRAMGPATDSAARIVTAPQAAGALYVLEGARLGGRLIADRLRRAGHPLGSPGYRFFGDLRDDVAERWRRFRSLVDAPAWTTQE